MRVNFNNKKTVNVTAKSLSKFLDSVAAEIRGNKEHFYLQYKKNKKSVERKWDRTEFTDSQIFKGVKTFLTSALKK